MHVSGEGHRCAHLAVDLPFSGHAAPRSTDIETQGYALTIEADIVYALLGVEVVRIPTGEIEMKQSGLIAKVL